LREERKGPRVGAPPQALEGFLRGAGLASIDEGESANPIRKGILYVAVPEEARARGRGTSLRAGCRALIGDFPWPKSMRWGGALRAARLFFRLPGREPLTLRWVRPLRSVLCTFGRRTEEPVVVPIEIAGIVASNVTYGHRFMAAGSLSACADSTITCRRWSALR
jgi:glycyl-tRNA synthetase beta chain